MEAPRFVLVAVLLGSVFGGACAPAEEDDVGDDDSAITNIPNTSVLNQGQTGNCWLYATAAWIESLRAQRTGDATTHYSPAYWNYWQWYRDILYGHEQVEFGGFFHWGLDLVRERGLMVLGDFVSAEVSAPLTAQKRINAALAKGALSTPEARANVALVRATLDEAFGLSAATRRALSSTFGEDGRKTFEQGATPSGKILRAQDVPVRSPRRGSAPLDTTLDELLPLPDGRSGPNTWVAALAPRREGSVSSVSTGIPGVFAAANGLDHTVAAGETLGAIARKFGTTVDEIAEANGIVDANRISVGQHLLIPSQSAPKQDDREPPAPPPVAEPEPDPWRAYTLRLQRALHDGAALPIDWFVNFDDVDKTGHFERRSTKTTAVKTGWHETLITDYEATNVPGFGTLKAGTVATEEQKQAALDPSTQLRFFRVKNSWGSGALSWFFTPLAPKAGYNDLDLDYLKQSLPVCVPKKSECPVIGPFVHEVYLPPGY